MQRIHLDLEDYPLNKITFTDITRVSKGGDTLLAAAQREKNRKYLDHFYLLALDFFKYERTGEIDPDTIYDENPVTITADDLDDETALEEKNSQASQVTLTRHNILWYAIQLLQSEKNLRSLMSAGCKADTVFYTNGVAMSAFFTALDIENTVAMHVLHAKDKKLIRTPNHENLLPIHWTAKHGKLLALKYLHIIDNQLVRETTDSTDSNCLHVAVQAKQQETAVWLLGVHGNSRHLLDKNGYTPAHYLVMNDDDNEILVNALIGMDARHVVSAEHAEFPNKTPLQLAIELQKCKLLERLFLLNKSIFNPIATGAAGNCLHLAAEKMAHHSARWLLEKFPNMKDAADIYGYTPLHYAALNNDESMAKTLCEAKANINCKSNNRAKFANKSPLQLAIEQGKKNLLDILMPAVGYTLAHYAVIQKDIGLLTSILTFKHDCTTPSAKTSIHGEVTPLQLAAMLGDSEMVRMMLQSAIHPSASHPVTETSTLSPEMQTALGLIAYIPKRKEEESTNSYLTQFSNFAGVTYGEAEKTATAEKLLQYLINAIPNPISLLNDRERDILRNGRLKGIAEGLMKTYDESLLQKPAIQMN